MQVADIMHRDVVTVNGRDTFAEAAKVLRDHGISSVVVKGDRGPQASSQSETSSASSPTASTPWTPRSGIA